MRMPSVRLLAMTEILKIDIKETENNLKVDKKRINLKDNNLEDHKVNKRVNEKYLKLLLAFQEEITEKTGNLSSEVKE